MRSQSLFEGIPSRRRQSEVPTLFGRFKRGNILAALGLALLFILVLLVVNYCLATGRSGRLHTRRFFHAAALLPDGRVMVMGGMTSKSPSLWNQLLSILQKLPWIGSKSPVYSGYTTEALNSTEVFDPKTGKWSDAPPLLEPFMNAKAFMLNGGRIFVGAIGDEYQDGYYPYSEIFDPVKKSWSICDGGTHYHSNSYALFPNDQMLKFELLDKTEDIEEASILDPKTRQWRRHPAMDCTYGFQDVPTVYLLKDGRILVEEILSHLFDPKTGQWSTIDQQDYPMYAVAILKDGTAIRAGGTGEDKMYAGSAWLDESAKSWKPLPDLHFARAGLTLTVLDSGKVLAAGGVTASCELFDPATQKWIITGSLHHIRSGHTATKLLDGKVIVVGGETDFSASQVLDSCELYDPVTGIWTEL